MVQHNSFIRACFLSEELHSFENALLQKIRFIRIYIHSFIEIPNDVGNYLEYFDDVIIVII